MIILNIIFKLLINIKKIQWFYYFTIVVPVDFELSPPR